MHRACAQTSILKPSSQAPRPGRGRPTLIPNFPTPSLRWGAIDDPAYVYFFAFKPYPFSKNQVSSIRMKFIPRLPRLRHDTPCWIDNPEYFITLACKFRGLNQLCQPAVAKVILESVRHRQHRNIWRWELLVHMPDHLHGIVYILNSSNLEESITNWKRWISSVAGVGFQEGFFDHRIRGISSALQKWNYVNENPVRAGLVSCPEKWPYRWTTKDFSS